jgi:hypothetical protein
VPNTPMIRITQDPTDRDDPPVGAGAAPAAAGLPLTTASFDGGHARRLGDGAEVDPTSEWLLERLLELRVPELQHLPVEPKGIAGVLGLGDATNALDALLELDLSTLLDLVPTEIPIEQPQFEQSVRFAAEIHVEATAKVLSLKPLGVVDDGTTTFVDSRQLDDVPNVPPIWFRPQIVTVMAANANFGPGGVGDTNAAANAVAENAADGAAVGLTAQASDPEGDAVTYSLTDGAGGRFAIDPNTGIVTVANASLLDFETNTSHSITVVASSSGGTSSHSYAITVGNTNEGPGALSDANAAANAVAENAADGAAAGLIGQASDPEGDTVTYSLSDDAGGRFAIDPNTGIVTVANASLLDFETNASHGITVVASSSGGTSSQSYTITVSNANEGPGALSDVNAAANAVAENAANGTAVGLTAQVSDPEGDTVTYSLSDDAGGRFAIDPNTGIVTVANASLLDFETNASHSITVVASSSGGTSSQSYTITVTDVAEPPVAIDDSVNTNEDAAFSGNVLSNDTGGAGPLTVSLGSGPVSGTLTLNANGSFTYTPDVNFNGSDSFTYVVTDSLGATDTGVVTIAVAPLGIDIFGTSGADTINGTAARENIYGLNGADVIHAGGGNDYVDGGIGKDDIYGEDGDDWLIGGNGTDQLYGGNGNDILDGSNGGNSVVFGEAGDDTLIWSAALKTADGGAGTDTLRADLGSVNLTSSSGGVASIEIIDLSRGSSASTVTLSAQDVLDISDTDVLKILGTSTDSVQAGTGWTDGGVADGVHTYTKDVSGSLATLIVDVDVTINPDILT